jgi:hypothetical protein
LFIESAYNIIRNPQSQPINRLYPRRDKKDKRTEKSWELPTHGEWRKTCSHPFLRAVEYILE